MLINIIEISAKIPSATGRQLDPIEESFEEDFETDSEDSGSDTDSVEEHLAFLDSISGLKEDTDGEVLDRTSKKTLKLEYDQTHTNYNVLSRKTVKMYHKLCKRSQKLYRANHGANLRLQSRDCLVELVAEIYS